MIVTAESKTDELQRVADDSRLINRLSGEAIQRATKESEATG